jgi:hypothetical protein
MYADDQPGYARKVPPPGEIEQKGATEWIAAGSAAVSAATQLWQAHTAGRKPTEPAPPPPPPKDD